MKNFFNFKALVLSFVLAMICALPVSAQQSDDFFRVDDDTYSNRDVVGMIWATGGFTPADPEAPIGSGLLIMVAAGAGYVVVRRRRSIRKGTTLLLAFAILLGLTQCKKKVDTINAVVTNGIPMTLEAYNGGRTSVSDEGIINWTAGDKIYVVCDGECVGYVENTAGALTTFTGTVTGVTTGAHTFHYYYVGNQTIADAATSFEMDFSDQTGNLDDLGDFHVGHGSQEISYTAGDEISAAAEMTSLVSVGYFDIAGMAEVGEKVFMYGENVNNKISINFSTNVVTNTKVDTEHNNNYISLGIVSAGATCGRYVMLVPNDGTETTISFVSKRTSGSYTFPRGIETGKFYCKSDNTSTPLTISPVAYTPGSLRGEFTINNSGDKVHFSQGNLQCVTNASPDGEGDYDWSSASYAWSFKDHQYDMDTEGDVGDNYKNRQVISHFGYGTSGYNNMHPYMTSEDESDYPAIDIANTEYDWGVHNAISNGGNQKGLWRTLKMRASTDKLGEWRTIFLGRPGSCYAKAFLFGDTDHGIHGIIVFPDNYCHPACVSDLNGINEEDDGSWDNGNKFNDAEWAVMEAAGCVFLPAAGQRDDDREIWQVGDMCAYWSSVNDADWDDSALRLDVESDEGPGMSSDYNYYGFSVRLVRDVE